MAKKLSEHVGSSRWYETAHSLEEASRKVLQEKKPDNTIYANVDFYTAPVLADLGIPGDEFTCLFACGRIAGWTAHILEQLADNRLIRPQATYDGPQSGPYVPIEKRAANGVRG
jgi:citrate synthase